MILDYLLQPLINTVWIAIALHERYVPQVPYIAWAALIAVIMAVLNLAGVRSSARASKLLPLVMSVVVVAFVVLATRFLYGSQGWGGLFSIQPFYDPKTFNSHRIWTATRSEEHTSELQSQSNLVCRLLLEKKKNKTQQVAVSTIRNES